MAGMETLLSININFTGKPTRIIKTSRCATRTAARLEIFIDGARRG